MSKYYKLAQLQSLPILTIYRLLLKNLKLYPSTNRYSIMIAMQDEFRSNMKSTPQLQPKLRKKAQMGLRHVLYYIEKNQLLKRNQYHNADDIEPMAKTKEENIYF